jgi:hypothetical protein
LWGEGQQTEIRSGDADTPNAVVHNVVMTRSGRRSIGVTIDDVRALASTLERSYEAVVRDRVKFRVGRIVYLAFSRDDTLMGFAFSKEEREALVASEPNKFMLPKAGDMRYNWVVVRLAEIDHDEMVEIVIEAWRMVVPKKVFNAYDRCRTEQHQ